MHRRPRTSGSVWVSTTVSARISRVRPRRGGIFALFDRIPAMRLVDGFEYENVFRHVFHRPKRLPVVLS